MAKKSTNNSNAWEENKNGHNISMSFLLNLTTYSKPNVCYWWNLALGIQRINQEMVYSHVSQARTEDTYLKRSESSQATRCLTS